MVRDMMDKNRMKKSHYILSLILILLMMTSCTDDSNREYHYSIDFGDVSKYQGFIRMENVSSGKVRSLSGEDQLWGSLIENNELQQIKTVSISGDDFDIKDMFKMNDRYLGIFLESSGILPVTEGGRTKVTLIYVIDMKEQKIYDLSEIFILGYDPLDPFQKLYIRNDKFYGYFDYNHIGSYDPITGEKQLLELPDTPGYYPPQSMYVTSSGHIILGDTIYPSGGKPFEQYSAIQEGSPHCISSYDSDTIYNLRDGCSYKIASDSVIIESGTPRIRYNAKPLLKETYPKSEKNIYHIEDGFSAWYYPEEGMVEIFKVKNNELTKETYPGIDKFTGKAALVDNHLVYEMPGKLIHLNINTMVKTTISEGVIPFWEVVGGGVMLSRYLTGSSMITEFYDFNTNVTMKQSDSVPTTAHGVWFDL